MENYCFDNSLPDNSLQKVVEKRALKRQANGDEGGSHVQKKNLSRGPTIIDAPDLRTGGSYVEPCTAVTSPSTSETLAARKSTSLRRLSVDAPVTTPEERELEDELVGEAASVPSHLHSVPTTDSIERAQYNVGCKPQQSGSKVDFDDLRECHSVPSPLAVMSVSNEQQTINRILSWKTEWLQQPEACRGSNIERGLVAKVANKFQQVLKNANDSCDFLAVKEVTRINFKVSELTFFSSTSTLPRNYEIGSLLLIKTSDSNSFGYISRLWRGAGETRFVTVQTSLDYAKLDDVLVKTRLVCEILSELKSIIYLEIFCHPSSSSNK